jgi:hypothetical protein
MINEKVTKAFKSAIVHLENSVQALNKKDEKSLADSLWHVATELEFALFLISITYPNEISQPNSKRNPEPKKTEHASMLAEAENLLNKAETFVANERLLDAYKNAYVARHYMLKVQEELAKKKQ